MDNENQPTNSSSGGGNKKWIIIAAAVVIIVIIAAGGGFFYTKNQSKTAVESDNTANTTNTEEAAQPTSAPTESAASVSGQPTGSTSKSAYKDGTYSATGAYQTHAGPEKIAVKLTLSNGVVVAAVVTEAPNDQMSKMMQEDFIANFKPMVVGKNIDEIKLGKVSGSSLTPMGFNAAVEAIRAQAKS